VEPVRQRQKPVSTEGREGIGIFSQNGGVYVDLGILFGLAVTLQTLIIIMFDINASERLYWDSNRPVPYLIAYAAAAVLFVPLALVTCSCIYSWSTEPLIRLARASRTKS
jgi:hypothetical protein